MSNLIIIGVSALGRETYSHARACGLTVKGFLDSRSGLLDRFPGYPPILSSVEDYSVSKEDVFVCAVGDPSERRRYVEMVAAKGGRFVSVVHPSAVLGMNASIGAGCIIQPFAVVGNDASIGQHALIGPQSLVEHDCKAGDYATLSPGCHVAGWCTLGEGVFLGIHSAVIPHVNLGSGVFVAAGAVVVKSIGSGRVMGVPAKPVS